MSENVNDQRYVYYRTESEPYVDGSRTHHLFRLDRENGGETLNVALLRRTLEWITEHPETHEQRAWFGFRREDGPGEPWTERSEVMERLRERGAHEAPVPALADTACGTSGCLFGWAAVLEGSRVVVEVRGDQSGNRSWAVIRLINSNALWGETGAEVLGLSRGNAEALSNADNSVGDLWRMASALTGGEIVIPEQFAGYDGFTEALADNMRSLEPTLAELRRLRQS